MGDTSRRILSRKNTRKRIRPPVAWWCNPSRLPVSVSEPSSRRKSSRSEARTRDWRHIHKPICPIQRTLQYKMYKLPRVSNSQTLDQQCPCLCQRILPIP
uniref:Uncharacterized protein n=1 Tax=Cacopsylla melanoneura TaxID=428564 RepID=A0A8D9AZF4_9HEMI